MQPFCRLFCGSPTQFGRFFQNHANGTFSETEYVHFLDIAYGSAREVEYQIGLAHRLGFLPDDSCIESTLCRNSQGF